MTTSSPLSRLAVLPLLASLAYAQAPNTAAAKHALADETRQGQTATEIDPRIWVIHQSRDGDYWFGSNGSGLYQYNGKRCIQHTLPGGRGCNQIRDLQEHSNGHLLIGTAGGVFKMVDGTITALDIVKPAAGQDGWRLDPEDVWIRFDPGPYGVLRYDGEKLYHLQLPKSPSEAVLRNRFSGSPGWFTSSSVYSIYRDRRGHMWFGTAGLGLCRYDGRTFGWMYEEHLTTTPRGGAFGIRSIFEDRAGDFWICNPRHRFEMSPEVASEGDHSLIRYTKKPGLPGAESDEGPNFSYFPSITEDRAGTLWFACGGGRVLKYDGEQVTAFPVAAEPYVATIHCDRQGKLWIGTVEQGIFTLEDGRFAPFKLP